MKPDYADRHDEYAHIYEGLAALNGIYASENIAMYTLSITIIGFAWECENYMLFLLVYVLLIPFQLLLGGHLNTFLKDGAYIMVFHEADNPELSWEYASGYFENCEPQSLGHFRFPRMGCTILGAVSFLAAVFLRLTAAFNGEAQKFNNLMFGIVLGLALIAEVITFLVNIHYVGKTQIEKRSEQYKELFIEAAILLNAERRIQKEGAEDADRILDQEISSALQKYMAYSPLSSVASAMLSKEEEGPLKRMCKEKLCLNIRAYSNSQK